MINTDQSKGSSTAFCILRRNDSTYFFLPHTLILRNNQNNLIIEHKKLFSGKKTEQSHMCIL